MKFKRNIDMNGHRHYTVVGHEDKVEIHNDNVNKDLIGYKCFLVLNFMSGYEKKFDTLFEAKRHAEDMISLNL